MTTSIPGNELIRAAVEVSVIAGLTGLASGGQAIALLLIALLLIALPYLDQGVDPAQLHRIVAISSGAIDSLSHNGYVMTTIRAICRETHQRAYAAVGALKLIVPLVGPILAVVLFNFV